MKKYPKVDWKPIDKYSMERMDKYEKIIKDYLKMEQCWDGYSYPTEVLAYNIAFLLLEV